MIIHETENEMDKIMSLQLNVLADIVSAAFNTRHTGIAFVLVAMVPNANADGDTALNYISNVDRDTGSQALKAMIEEWERLTDKETRQ